MFRCWVSGTEKDKTSAEVGLRRLILGNKWTYVDDSHEMGRQFMSEFRGAIEESFRPPVSNMLNDCGHVCYPCALAKKWEMRKKTDISKCNSAVQSGILLIRAHYATKQCGVLKIIETFNSASYVRTDLFGIQRRAYA